MANQLFDATYSLVPFENPGALVSPYTLQPWGFLNHRGSETLAAATGAGELLQLEFALPANFVYRLTHCNVYVAGNTDNTYQLNPKMRIFYSGSEGLSFSQVEYPMQASTVTDDLRRYFQFGIDSAKGAGAQGAASDLSSISQLMLTSIPDGVGTQEPHFRVESSAASSAGGLHYNLTWLAFTIAQRNDAINHARLLTV